MWRRRGDAAVPALAVVAAAVVVAAAGCGGSSKPSDAEQVTRTLHAFLTATATGDGAAACGQLDAGARLQLLAVVRRAAGSTATTCQDAIGFVRVAAPPALRRAFQHARVQRVAVQGARATAVVADGRSFRPQRVVLRRTNAGWRIAGVPGLLGG